MADVIVAVDAMGGDNAPVEIVKGAVDAVKLRPEIKVLLVGIENVVKAELAKYSYDKDRIEVINATEVIATEEPPVMAIRKKKESSIVKAMYIVKAFIQVMITRFVFFVKEFFPFRLIDQF